MDAGECAQCGAARSGVAQVFACFRRDEIAGGETVTGFVCEPHGTHGAVEITRLGGWRSYLNSRSEVPKEIEYPADTISDADQ